MPKAIDYVLPALLEQRALNKKEEKYFKKLIKVLAKKKLEDCDSDEAFVLGYMSEQQANDPAAIDAYTHSIEQNPEFEAAYKFRGAAHIRQKNFVDGESDLAKALELDPDYTDALLEMASMKYEAGSYEDAENMVDKVIELDPENTIAFALKGSILDKHEKYDESLTWFDKAVEINPEDGQLYMQRGIVRLFADKPEEALEDVKMCRKLSGSHQVVNFNFGLIYLVMPGNEKEAFRNFEKAFKKEPHILKNYLTSAQDFEADRLIDTLRDNIKRIESDKSEESSFYKSELLDLLKSKLPV